MTNRKIKYWVIPPEADAEFVAHMEDVLDTYSKPYDSEVPVICMDEQPVQLVKEVKQPIAANKEHPKRVDYEYERAGVANVFMFAEPLSGWREVAIRPHKTKVDWAMEMARLMEGRYAKCKTVRLVCDNLNTHTMGAFYEVFEAERARSIVRRVEFHYTPKHASWINQIEVWFSILVRKLLKWTSVKSVDELNSKILNFIEYYNRTMAKPFKWKYQPGKS